MKRLLTTSLALLTSLLIIAQIVPTISEPISVTANSSEYGKHLPRVSTLDDGTVVVFWSKSGSNAGLYFAKLEGNTFGEPIQVPTGSFQPDIWGGALGPGFAIHGNSIFVTFEIWGQAIYCVRSTDGGLTFDEPVVAMDPEPGRAATLPAITVDYDGNPIIGAINTTTSEQDAQYEIVQSMDGGLTFGAPVVASAEADGEEVCECCPSSLLATPSGDIYVSFRNNNFNTRDIWISRSTDGGASFPNVVDIDPTDWIIQGCPSTGPQTIQTGNTLATVFFSNGADWEKGVYLSTLDMLTFEPSTTTKLPFIEGSTGTQNFPRISGMGDTLGIVWQENISPFYVIGFAWSLEGLEGISETAINIGGADNPQRYPDIHYNNGSFHIVYEDQASASVFYQQVNFMPATSLQNINDPDMELKIHPNPASDAVRISGVNASSGKYIIELCDLSGQTKYRLETNKSSPVLDISKLDKGIYILTASNSSKTISSKLVIH